MDELDLTYYLTSSDPQAQAIVEDAISLYYNSPYYIPDTPFEELPPETQEELIFKVLEA